MNRFPYSMRYVAATMTYGAVRKVVRLKNAEVESWDWDSDRKPVPMLLSQKVLLTTVGSFCSIYVWPYYAYTDMLRLEIDYNKRDPSVYGFKQNKYMIDYMIE
jgi:hypothetical protein